MARHPLTARELTLLVSLTAVALVAFVGAVYLVHWVLS